MIVKEFIWYKIMLIYVNFKFNIIHLFYIVEEHECSHQDVSQAIYNMSGRVDIQILAFGSIR
jgi:hypothetical protein